MGALCFAISPKIFHLFAIIFYLFNKNLLTVWGFYNKILLMEMLDIRMLG